MTVLAVVKVPLAMCSATDEGVLVTWLYEDGAPIREGDSIAEIMVQKAPCDVTAPASGTLRIIAERDAIVSGDMTIAEIVQE
jgi:pyruvate/2-oxoglutarate dehydrogenase complex dihydrolipoamide acyltransferase (E2) component